MGTAQKTRYVTRQRDGVRMIGWCSIGLAPLVLAASMVDLEPSATRCSDSARADWAGPVSGGCERDGALAGGGESTRLRHSPAGDQAAVRSEERIDCPFCAEPIRVEASCARIVGASSTAGGSGESGALTCFIRERVGNHRGRPTIGRRGSSWRRKTFRHGDAIQAAGVGPGRVGVDAERARGNETGPVVRHRAERRARLRSSRRRPARGTATSGTRGRWPAGAARSGARSTRPTPPA